MLQLKDGENQVLAGLINNEDRSSGSKVPGLGNLPIVGRLFGTTRDDNDKTEIVLSITPHLVRTVQRPAAGAVRVQRRHRNQLPSPSRPVAARAGGDAGARLAAPAPAPAQSIRCGRRRRPRRCRSSRRRRTAAGGDADPGACHRAGAAA